MFGPGLRPAPNVGGKTAQNERSRLLAEKAEGILPPPGRFTVGELLDAYVESRNLAGRAPRTLLNDEQVAERIRPRIGRIPLADLKPAHLEALERGEMASAGRQGPEALGHGGATSEGGEEAVAHHGEACDGTGHRLAAHMCSCPLEVAGGSCRAP